MCVPCKFHRSAAPYSQDRVAELIAADDWDGLENYVCSFMPHYEEGAHMVHANLILQIRRGALVQLVKQKNHVGVVQMLEHQILPMKSSTSRFVHHENVTRQIDQIRRVLEKNMYVELIKSFV
jgi:hypothetical protein